MQVFAPAGSYHAVLLFAGVVLWSFFAGGEAICLCGGSCSRGALAWVVARVAVLSHMAFRQAQVCCSLLCHGRGPWGAPQASSVRGPPQYHHVWFGFAQAVVKALPASLQAEGRLWEGCTWATGCSPGVLLFGLFLPVAVCFMCSLKAVGICG